MMKFGEHIEESLAAEIQNEPKSEAANQAKKMGLTYAGFGRYLDKKGKVVYIVVRGKLVPYKGPDELVSARAKAYDTQQKELSSPKPAAKSKDGKKSAKKVDPYAEVDKASKIYDQRIKDDHKIQYKMETDAYKVNGALMKHYDEYFKGLNNAQLQTIKDYTAQDYSDINRYLYKGHDEGQTASRDKEIVDQISTIDSTFDEAEAPFPYTIYTGLSDRYDPKKIKAGEDYIFRGYISGSLDVNKAAGTFTDEKAKNRVVLQVDLKAGQKALHIAGISTHDWEMETMLPRGSTIKIVSGPFIVKPDALGVEDDDDKTQDINLFHCIVVQEDDDE